jgi:hypothetical protein
LVAVRLEEATPRESGPGAQVQSRHLGHPQAQVREEGLIPEGMNYRSWADIKASATFREINPARLRRRPLHSQTQRGKRRAQVQNRHLGHPRRRLAPRLRTIYGGGGRPGPSGRFRAGRDLQVPARRRSARTRSGREHSRLGNWQRYRRGFAVGR